ncbi:hypothetical protein U27_02174 [Candidatus Vecturithrix granuli]|uniref:Uncharacterized protein n=1 Tax=Vecturithrix granuli TaxID=1499967 RepID=A0A0S6WC64_VECG1|nr:hypothetical protein U27_02174 [Candidatus Vecturithrix granuli]
MKTIGIVGIAKNTGKTTTTNALIEYLYQQDAKICVTSIGYDGEEIDNITALPKPRISLNPGTLVVTASDCVAPQAESYRILRQTDIHTVLGNIQICQTEKPVNAIVAGPKTGDDLQRVMGMLQDFACDVLLVDGALNRVAPFAKVENLVIAVGPAANHDLDELAREIKLIVDLTRLTVWQCKGDPFPFSGKSAAGSQGVDVDPQNNAVWVHGPVYATTLQKKIAEFRQSTPVSALIIASALHLLSGSEYREIQRFMQHLRQASIDLFVQKQIRLLGLTINPAYPAPVKKGLNIYQLRYVDEQIFKEKLQALLDHESLMINVKNESAEPLLERAV